MSERCPPAAVTCQRAAPEGATCHCGRPAFREVHGYVAGVPFADGPRWLPVCDGHNPFRAWNEARPGA